MFPSCKFLPAVLFGAFAFSSRAIGAEPEILTPKPGPEPRINGPGVLGARPGSPIRYYVPVTGDRPMEYGVKNLPQGLTLDRQTGIISGSLPKSGEYEITLAARNAKGMATKSFKIVVGDTIALTPPMGWDSWNCWEEA